MPEQGKKDGQAKAHPRDAARSARKERTTEARKKAHREANEAQHKANLEFVREHGIEPRLSTVHRQIAQRRDKEIIYVPREVTKRVRPSKLKRLELRAQEQDQANYAKGI